MGNIYTIILVGVEELNRLDAVVSVVYDYHSLSILGPSTNCHWHSSPLLSPRVIKTISKCPRSTFPNTPQRWINCMVRIDTHDSEKVLVYGHTTLNAPNLVRESSKSITW